MIVIDKIIITLLVISIIVLFRRNNKLKEQTKEKEDKIAKLEIENEELVKFFTEVDIKIGGVDSVINKAGGHPRGYLSSERYCNNILSRVELYYDYFNILQNCYEQVLSAEKELKEEFYKISEFFHIFNRYRGLLYGNSNYTNIVEVSNLFENKYIAAPLRVLDDISNSIKIQNNNEKYFAKLQCINNIKTILRLEAKEEDKNKLILEELDKEVNLLQFQFNILTEYKWDNRTPPSIHTK